MTASSSLPLPIANYANCHAFLAWSSRSADDYLRFLTPSLGAGGLFFQLAGEAALLARQLRLTVAVASKTVAFPALKVMEG